MSTIEVRLQGELGKQFGRTWNVNARSPGHALSIIDANLMGALKTWVRQKASKFTQYKVVCEFQDGTKRSLSDEEFKLNFSNIKRIRYTPAIAGASGVVQAAVGVVAVIAGFALGQPWLIGMGVSLAVGGIAGMLAPKPQKAGERSNSHMFNGTERTQEQGAPVPLIYGRCLVSGFPISVAVKLDQSVIPQVGTIWDSALKRST